MSNLFKTTGFFEGTREFKTIFGYTVFFDETSTIQWFDSENEFELFSMQPTDLSLLVGAFEENFKDCEMLEPIDDNIIIELNFGPTVRLFASGWVEITYEEQEFDTKETKLAKSTIDELKSLYGAYKLMKKEQVEFEVLKEKLNK